MILLLFPFLPHTLALSEGIYENFSAALGGWPRAPGLALWAWISLGLVKLGHGDPALKFYFFSLFISAIGLSFFLLGIQRLIEHAEPDVDSVRVSILLLGIGIFLFNHEGFFHVSLLSPARAVSMFFFHVGFYFLSFFYCRFERHTLIRNPNWAFVVWSLLIGLSLSLHADMLVTFLMFTFISVLVARPRWHGLLYLFCLFTLALGFAAAASLIFFPAPNEWTLNAQSDIGGIFQYILTGQVRGASGFAILNLEHAKNYLWNLMTPIFLFPFCLGLLFLAQQQVVFAVGILGFLLLRAAMGTGLEVIHSDLPIYQWTLQHAAAVGYLPIVEMSLAVGALGIYQLTFWADKFSTGFARALTLLCILPAFSGVGMRSLLSISTHQFDEVEKVVQALETDSKDRQLIVTDSDFLYLKLIYAQKFQNLFQGKTLIHPDWEKKFAMGHTGWEINENKLVLAEPGGSLKSTGWGDSVRWFSNQPEQPIPFYWNRYLRWFIRIQQEPGAGATPPWKLQI